MIEFKETIDREIIRDMQLAAQELASEAWDEGLRAGIPADLMAEEMIRCIIGELADARGQAGAARVAERIGRLANEGRFLAPKLLQ